MSILPWVMLPPLLHFGGGTTKTIIDDYLDYQGQNQSNCSLQQKLRTERCYSWLNMYLPQNPTGYAGSDLSEGFYYDNEGEFQRELKPQQATLAKYDKIYFELGLKRGDRVLDMGCGYGHWMNYLQSKGVEVTGLTLSKEQADFARERGLDARVQDYRIEDTEFLGQFDAITALGSTEHVCTAQGLFRQVDGRNEADLRCIHDLKNLYNLFNKYLISDGKVFITSLVRNEKHQRTAEDWFHAYLLERHYGGFYPTWSNIETALEQSTMHLGENWPEDNTAGYHWISVKDPEHFGNMKINWRKETFRKLTFMMNGFFTDPHFTHRWLHHNLKTWMWQFGGLNTEPLSVEDIRNAPMNLKYFLLEKEKKGILGRLKMP